MSTYLMLSDEELAELGVKRERDEYGKLLYSIPCMVCGRTVYSRTFSYNKAYRCGFCKKEIAKVHKANARAVREEAERVIAEGTGVDYEHYHRFENGAKKFGESYVKDIELARKAIGKFDSVPEVVACIELLHIGARVIPQQPVGSYTVDFCLPTEKVIIEVDGSLYHNDKAKRDMRDYAISYMLEGDWIIRHVPSDAIMKNHSAFGRGMKSMLKQRREALGIREKAG